MNELFCCDQCGQETPVEQHQLIGDLSLCPSCLEEETALCDRCEERILLEHSFGGEGRILCESCYYDHYTRCTTCGTLLCNEDAYYTDEDEGEEAPYCYDCYEEAQERQAIHTYNYKPEPVFYGDGARFFGVELEIDNGGEDSGSARRLLDLANQAREHLYCKHDGSLNDGFELVSHPMTLDYHREQMPWKEVVDKAVSLGYCSHKTGTCGLHVHVNRNSFGETVEEQDNAIARVLYFVENHWPELLRFSRRTQNQLNQWASRYGRKDNPKATLDAAKQTYARYSCVNLTNYATIEFRIFRGTLKYNTFIATLQLVNEICSVAVSLSDEEMDELSWISFVESLDPEMVPELIQYLKERRLYVNELVTVNAEGEL